ncbi:hypothetical protein DY000_02018017 [Brassica cretica]|uniref:Uncharacterized protein n=1 Tax=Brassica cretica TaxID=69181 RepID=A0ABQ7DDX9_BRACR|nr:hypothetical protein DY000_02018018 [Brassica cretica]KAF3569449.1 hypothetical protein DY000_02018017 [Brassica cretica]
MQDARTKKQSESLKWGVQRSLRCMQSHGGADNRNRRLETERWRSEEGIEEYGEKMKESTNTKRAHKGFLPALKSPR